MALQATAGQGVPNIDDVHRKVVRALAGRPTLPIRIDDLLNVNGLYYSAQRQRRPLSLVQAPSDDAFGAVRALRLADVLITGTSPVLYHPYVTRVEKAAKREGWERTRVWTLACANTIELWEKHAHGVARVRATRPRQTLKYPSAVLRDLPGAYWRLDDGTCSATDASDNGNAGVLEGKPRLGAPGLIKGGDRAVQFDGRDDEMTFGDSPTVSPTRAISFEAWFRPTSVPTAQDSAWHLLAKWFTADLYLRGGSKPAFVFAVYNPADSTYKPGVIATTRVKSGKTYYVVGTYDGSELRIYVNGRLEAKANYRGPVVDAPHGGVIAAEGWGELPSPHFRGTIDEVAIYRTALSSARVQAHYLAGTRH
jgi:hypothetical protein